MQIKKNHVVVGNSRMGCDRNKNNLAVLQMFHTFVLLLKGVGKDKVVT